MDRDRARARSPGRWLLLLPSVLAVVACRGPVEVCVLTIIPPGNAGVFDPAADEANDQAGLQAAITVKASGAPPGTAVELRSTAGPSSTGLVVAGGQVVFTSFTLFPDGFADGAVTLNAAAGACRAAPVTVTRRRESLAIGFVGLADNFRLGPADNRNPDDKDRSFVRDIAVFTSAPDQSRVALSLNGNAQPPELVVGSQAQWKGVVWPPSARGTANEDVVVEAAVSDRLGNTASARLSGRVDVVSPLCQLVGLLPGVAIVKGQSTPVLNLALDRAPKKPGEQVDVVATGATGASVSLLVDKAERDVAQVRGQEPIVFADLTLAEGLRVLQARCGLGQETVSSPRAAILVDSIAPSCRLTAPVDGRSLTPLDDEEPQRPGIQVTATLTTSSADAEGNPVSFGVNGADQGAPATAATMGSASHLVTLSTPGARSNRVTAAVADDAGNLCVAAAEVGLEARGCALRFLAPSPEAPPRYPVIRVDDDTSPPILDGLQFDVSLAVDKRCVGRNVRFSIDGAPVATALVAKDGGQRLGARVDFPQALVCPPRGKGLPPVCNQIYHLFAELTDEANINTVAALDVLISAVPPPVTLKPTNPAVKCGGAFPVGAAIDLDPAAPGTQIIVQVATPARLVAVRVVNGMSDLSYPPQLINSQMSTLTLLQGVNTIVARAVDNDGNEGFSSPCLITVNGLDVQFTAPLAGGVILAQGGTVTGTVSTANASMTLFVDGAQVAARAAAGNRWSFDNLQLQAGAAHLLRVDGQGGGSGGSAQIQVIADGKAPFPIGALAVETRLRDRVTLTFPAPGDDNPPLGAYLVRWALAPITAPSFLVATPVPGPAPLAPGAKQTALVSRLYTGVPSWFAVATLDRAGNRSEISNLVTATPAFARLTRSAPADVAAMGVGRGFGSSAASGDFDGDGVADLVVGAPLVSYAAPAAAEGAVYLWFGGAGVLAGPPDVVLRGVVPGGRVGTALAVGDLDGDGRDDLAVGAPGLAVLDRDNQLVATGGVYVAYGSGLARGIAPRGIADVAPVLVSGDPDDPALASARLGAALAIGRFDGDAKADLAIGAPQAGAGVGAAFVLAGEPPKGALRVPRDLVARTVRGWRLLGDGLPMVAGFGSAMTATLPLEGPGDVAGEVVVALAGERLAVVALPGLAGDVDVATKALAVLRAGGPGATVASAPDGDANGYHELLLGDSSAVSGAGRLLAIDGAKLPGAGALLDAVPLAVVFTGQPGEGLGSCVGAIDLNGDGAVDFVGCGGGGAGRLRVHYGPSPLGQAAPSALLSPAAGAVSARTAVLLGDLDQDGLPDFLQLDPGHGANAGRVELFH